MQPHEEGGHPCTIPATTGSVQCCASCHIPPPLHLISTHIRPATVRKWHTKCAPKHPQGARTMVYTRPRRSFIAARAAFVAPCTPSRTHSVPPIPTMSLKLRERCTATSCGHSDALRTASGPPAAAVVHAWQPAQGLRLEVAILGVMWGL